MGEVAGRYELQGPLGSGGGGAVFSAFDRLLDRKVAVKLFDLPLPDDTMNSEMLKRFRIGAKAAGRLSHPNIVPVFDYGEDVQRAWIVMELVEGLSLRAVLDRGDRYSLPAALRLMEQILAALEYSHRAGVVHRDVKPANIMITRSGEAKLTDFGIARLEDSSLTIVGSVMGTPAYMAPEQFGGDVDQRVDIWAAGAVLYELVTGVRAFAGDAFATIMRRILTDDPPAPSARAQLPAGIDAIVARALAKRAEDRYASAADFAEALRGINLPGAVPRQADTASRPPLPPPQTVPPISRPLARALEQRRKVGSRPVMLAAAGGFLCLAGVAWLLTNESPAVPASQMGALPVEPPAHIATPVEQTAAAAVPPASTSLLQGAPYLSPPGNVSGAAPPEGAKQAPLVPPASGAEQPIPPPQQSASVAVPPSQFRIAAERVSQLPACGLISAHGDDNRLDVKGVLRRSDAGKVQRVLDEAGLRFNAGRSLALFDADYCNFLRALRPAGLSAEAAPRLMLLSSNPLPAGQNLRFRVAMPEWPAYLHVFYLSNNGEVGHLVQARSAPFPANFIPEFGEAFWRASEPFGTDLIIAVVSERPFFATRRRTVERQDEVVSDLDAALRQGKADGYRMALTAVALATTGRQ